MKNYFAQKEFLNFPERPSALQVYLFESIKKKLNIVRHRIHSPIIITSFTRTVKKYKSLINRGYHPSATSDHFWGEPILTLRRRDRLKYGKFFIFSAGAVDIVTPKIDTEYVFSLIVKLQKANKVNFGQIIYERSERSEWIHLSNPRTLVFNLSFLQRIGAIKYPFLKSIDGGKSYRRA